MRCLSTQAPGWRDLRARDVLFLVSCDGTQPDRASSNVFPDDYGVRFVRGAEVVSVDDDKDRAKDSSPETFGMTLRLDGIAYRNDVKANRLQLYSALNIVIRRDARSNTFKCVLSVHISPICTSLRTGRCSRRSAMLQVLKQWAHRLSLAGCATSFLAMEISVLTCTAMKAAISRPLTLATRFWTTPTHPCAYAAVLDNSSSQP